MQIPLLPGLSARGSVITGSAPAVPEGAIRNQSGFPYLATGRLVHGHVALPLRHGFVHIQIFAPGRMKETDRYIVFATSVRARSKQDLISKIPDEYKKRWGIETGYACMERVRPRTSSRNDSIRILLMYLPLVVYNAWIMENYAAGACADGGKPVITLRRLMFRFILIIAVSVLSSRYSHYLEFVG